VSLLTSSLLKANYFKLCTLRTVLDPVEGVCADPVDRVAILGRGGPDPHSRDTERQLAPDKGSGET
jgi:hypothetical protein